MTSQQTKMESNQSTTYANIFVTSHILDVSRIFTDSKKFSTAAIFTINTIFDMQNHNINSNFQTPIYIAVGVIGGVVIILFALLLIRWFKNKSISKKSSNSVFLYGKDKIDHGANPTSQSFCTSKITTGAEMVNELYVSADINEYDKVKTDQEDIYSKPMKKSKPDMIDNELYTGFDG